MPELRVQRVLTPARISVLAVAVVLVAASFPPARAAGSLTIAPVLSGLAWPVSLAFAPDGQWFVAERLSGAIRAVEAGQLLPQPWATLAVVNGGEQGLLSLAIDPRWSQGQRWVYAYHTYPNATVGGPMNRVVRLFDSGGVGTNLQVILDGIPAGSFHNGGILGFAPDGTLFATTGDAQTAGNAQDLSTPAGKVLRMNPDGSVPAENPFAATPGANPYVYTYGHRNVFGLAFRPSTGQPFITENGPADSDEVNALVPRGNYGWPTVRGVAGDPRFRDPVFVFPRVIAPTGAAFFVGSQIANLSGDLVFGDWNRGALNRLRFLGPTSVQVAFNDTPAYSPEGPQGVLDVDNGPGGYLYFTTPSTIYRVNGTAVERPGGGGPPEVPWWFFPLAGILLVAGATLAVLWKRRRTAK